MTTISRIATAALLIAAASCGGSGGSSVTGPPPPPPPPPPADCTPGGSTVCLEATSFNPRTVTIAVGATVTYNNGSGVTHDVVFDTPGAPADLGVFSSGIKTATFPSKGTFDYHCTIHGSSMSGQVVVQ